MDEGKHCKTFTSNLIGNIKEHKESQILDFEESEGENLDQLHFIMNQLDFINLNLESNKDQGSRIAVVRYVVQRPYHNKCMGLRFNSAELEQIIKIYKFFTAI